MQLVFMVSAGLGLEVGSLCILNRSNQYGSQYNVLSLTYDNDLTSSTQKILPLIVRKLNMPSFSCYIEDILSNPIKKLEAS